MVSLKFIIMSIVFYSVYDVTSRSSFERLDHWMTEVDTYSTKGEAVKMLVGNKIDMVNNYLLIIYYYCDLSQIEK